MSFHIGDIVKMVNGRESWKTVYKSGKSTYYGGYYYKKEIVKILDTSPDDLHGYYLVEFQNIWVRHWIFWKRRKVAQISGHFVALSPLELLAACAE